MKLIYCSEPFSPSQPDSVYDREVQAALNIGLDYGLINYEALVDEIKPAAAVRRLPNAENPELAIYRGWMLTPQQYQNLYAALFERHHILINTPEQYRHCHYLPESYHVIEGHTPITVWLQPSASLGMDELMQKLSVFGSRPVVLKDYVKSRKHEWDEACFIPSAADQIAVERVVSRFLELQGEEINEGLVFREYVEFERLGRHSKSGMPLTKEFRLFYLDGRLLYALEYWEEGDYRGMRPPADLFREVAQRVGSRFFTMDVAQRINGEWMIVELGDGQVAGLPENANVKEFYGRMVEVTRGAQYNS